MDAILTLTAMQKQLMLTEWNLFEFKYKFRNHVGFFLNKLRWTKAQHFVIISNSFVSWLTFRIFRNASKNSTNQKNFCKVLERFAEFLESWSYKTNIIRRFGGRAGNSKKASNEKSKDEEIKKRKSNAMLELDAEASRNKQTEDQPHFALLCYNGL